MNKVLGLALSILMIGAVSASAAEITKGVTHHVFFDTKGHVIGRVDAEGARDPVPPGKSRDCVHIECPSSMAEGTRCWECHDS